MSKDLYVRVYMRGMYLAASLMVVGLLSVSARAQMVQPPEAMPAPALAQPAEMPAAEAAVGSYYDDCLYYWSFCNSTSFVFDCV